MKRTLTSLMLAAAIAAAPLSVARAQTAYYYYNPIFWPFLAAGAILGTAALIVTAPVRIVCSDCLPPPQNFYPYFAPPPPPPPIGYAPAR